MSDSDAELVRRTMAGDRSAFESLVATHLGRARAVARSVLHDDAAVDDVLQESFLRAYNRLGQLGELATFPAWLCVIVRNESISWIRRSTRARAPTPWACLALPEFGQVEVTPVHSTARAFAPAVLSYEAFA